VDNSATIKALKEKELLKAKIENEIQSLKEKEKAEKISLT
jgi:hypothetical protein